MPPASGNILELLIYQDKLFAARFICYFKGILLSSQKPTKAHVHLSVDFQK